MIFAHSVRPHKLRKIIPTTYVVAYIRSLNIIITKRATHFVVSVPAEKSFQPNPIDISTEM